ncbi:hypothetical protein NL50_04525 [Clostridium acetobutylicum]|nr:hypothetical protein NL50_04525 [Clostridium acetobutylicum]
MITNTHLLISYIVYKNLYNNFNFKLDMAAFALGNIKPDFINKEIRCPHTLNESLDSLIEYSNKLVKCNNSIRKFSLALGIVCHYICDYFCIYHRDGNEKKGILEHLIYEVKLDSNFTMMFLKGKLNYFGCRDYGGSIKKIIFNIEKEYKLEEKDFKRDIKYAIFAAIESSKFIVCSSLYGNQEFFNCGY